MYTWLQKVPQAQNIVKFNEFDALKDWLLFVSKYSIVSIIAILGLRDWLMTIIT